MLKSMTKCNVIYRVSKAADISKAVRIVMYPDSIVSMISFVTLSNYGSFSIMEFAIDCKGEKLG